MAEPQESQDTSLCFFSTWKKIRRPEVSFELILSSPIRNDCECLRFDSDDDSHVSIVPVVPSPVLASCDSELCFEELRWSNRREESEFEQKGTCFSVRSNQCSQSSDHPFSNRTCQQQLVDERKLKSTKVTGSGM